MQRWTVRAGRLLTLAVVALAWEAAGRLQWVDPDFLPPLSKVLATLWRLLHDAQFLTDIRVTAVECLFAFAIVTPLALGCGFVIGESQRLERTLGPALQVLLTVPKSIFLPMFILVFGVGFAEKVGFGFFSTIFIVIMSTTTAVESVKVDYLTVARSYGATPLQTAFRVYLPSMLPVLLEALRISMIFNLTGVILAEMYASRDGIGHQIATWGENFQMKQLLAGVLMIAVIAMTFNELVRSVETRCSHWRT